MPARNPAIATMAADKLIALGEQIRAHRKALHISATAAAEAAGLSRVTLHRIENGEPAVTIGAYFNAMAALKLDFGIIKPADLATEVPDADREGWIPARIKLADYPQLKQLAWQVHGTDDLTHEQVFGHLDREPFSAIEAAQYLEVSLPTLRRYVQAGRIKPSQTIGRSQLFSTVDLRALKRQRH